MSVSLQKHSSERQHELIGEPKPGSDWSSADPTGVAALRSLASRPAPHGRGTQRRNYVPSSESTGQTCPRLGQATKKKKTSDT